MDIQAYEDFLQMQILFRILKPFNLSKELVKEMLNMIKSAQNKIVSKISNELLFVKEYGKVIITNRIYENEEFYLEQFQNELNLESTESVKKINDLFSMITIESSSFNRWLEDK